MIILIVKIIIFIVILIMVFNFTLKKYVGNYIDNYSEVMNHLYYSRNPDKDQTGIYSEDKDKKDELSYEEYKYLVLEDDEPPKKEDKKSPSSDSDSNENEDTNTSQDTESSNETSPGTSPAPSTEKEKEKDNCAVCSMYTEVNYENNKKMCERKDSTGERVNCICRKACSKCWDRVHDSTDGGKLKFVYKSVNLPKFEDDKKYIEKKIEDFKNEISLIETKLKRVEKYSKEKSDLEEKLNKLKENSGTNSEIFKLENDIKLKDAQIKTSQRKSPQLQMDKNVIENKIARQDYTLKQVEEQIEKEKKKIEEEKEKECECEPHEIIYFKGDKCDKSHSNQNRPLPPGFQVLGSLFFMDVADLFELGYWARNAYKIKPKMKKLNAIANFGKKHSLAGRKAMQAMDGLDQDFKKMVDGLYDQMDDILENTKKLGMRAEKNVPLVRLNDDLIDLGADIDAMKAQLKANGMKPDAINKIFGNLDECRDIHKSDAFNDVFKLVEFDDGVKLQTGKILDDLDNFGKKLDGNAGKKIIADAQGAIMEIQGLKGVDPDIIKDIDGLIDGVQNPKGSSLFGKGKVNAEAMFGKASKTKSATKNLLKSKLKVMKQLDAAADAADTVGDAKKATKKMKKC